MAEYCPQGDIGHSQISLTLPSSSLQCQLCFAERSTTHVTCCGGLRITSAAISLFHSENGEIDEELRRVGIYDALLNESSSVGLPDFSHALYSPIRATSETFQVAQDEADIPAVTRE